MAKVQRLKGGKGITRNLGVHKFKKADAEHGAEVVAVDGTPCIIGMDAEGREYYVALGRVQTKPRSTTHGRTVYGRWRVPHDPAVPRALRGLETWVRHSSTPEECAENRRVTRALRPIPESDHDFGPLYGLREDVESMHHHIKERLVNERARSVGIARQRLDLHGYQCLLAVRTLVAWHNRTGGDLHHWFGEWRPPGAAAPAEAA